MPREHLTLYDYSDRELLLMMLDHADDDGWVSTHDLATALQVEGKYPARPVGIRLGWMKRYGAVERAEDKPEWRLTRQGLALAVGDLSTQERQIIEGLTSEQMLSLTRALTTRYRRVGVVAANLMRREWQYGAFQRKTSARQ